MGHVAQWPRATGIKKHSAPRSFHRGLGESVKAECYNAPGVRGFDSLHVPFSKEIK